MIANLNPSERVYLDLLRKVRNEGNRRAGRTEADTISLFGAQTRYDLSKGFPLLTTKEMNFLSIYSELIWFLEGSTDERRLAEIRYGRDRNDLSTRKTIWTQNAQAPYWTERGYATSSGDLGRVYGAQWRNWNSVLNKPHSDELMHVSVDQIERLIHGIKTDPHGRRHIVTAWNPGELDRMALPPCHVLFQCYVYDGKLSLHWFQRSVDKFLGEPYNIASYALLTYMLAQLCGLEPYELIHTQSDSHIYLDHIDAVDEQLLRTPFAMPVIELDRSIRHIDDFKLDSIHLLNYKHLPAISAPMAT